MSLTTTRLFCWRIDAADCTRIEAFVRGQLRFAGGATAIVIDYSCAPGQRCRAGQYNAIVSIVVPLDPGVDYAYWPPTYAVAGIDAPETLLPWQGTLPDFVAAELRLAGFEPNPTSSAPSTPPASASPWSADTTVEVPLDASHSVTVAISNDSGLPMLARVATGSELADRSRPEGDTVAWNPSGRAGPEVRLAWVGTICDRTAQVIIAPGARAITIVEGPRPLCDAAAVGRGLVLTFGQPIEARSIFVTVVAYQVT